MRFRAGRILHDAVLHETAWHEMILVTVDCRIVLGGTFWESFWECSLHELPGVSEIRADSGFVMDQPACCHPSILLRMFSATMGRNAPTSVTIPQRLPRSPVHQLCDCRLADIHYNHLDVGRQHVSGCDGVKHRGDSLNSTCLLIAISDFGWLGSIPPPSDLIFLKTSNGIS